MYLKKRVILVVQTIVGDFGVEHTASCPLPGSGTMASREVQAIRVPSTGR